MPVDPQVATLLDQLEQMGGLALDEMTPEQGRAAFAQMRQAGGVPEPVERIEDLTIPGPASDLKARIYTPIGEAPLPAMVFFHGGGWVIGDLETHDPLCRALANASGSVIVAVEYRLAPKHKFPAAVDDAFAALKWVVAHAAELGADPARIGVGGDSAGGNLSAVIAIQARDHGGPKLAYQLLIYPATDLASDTPSKRENGEGYFLTRRDMTWFEDHYIRSAEDKVNPLVSPMRTVDLTGLPPTIVVTAEFDPLRDEGEAYGEKLLKAGVLVKARRYDGMIHGFVSMSGVINRGRDALVDLGADVRELVEARRARVG
jgi:acetyl esterase